MLTPQGFQQIGAKPTPSPAAASSSLALMTGAKSVVAALLEHKVEVVFGYPGGVILPVFDELEQEPSISKIRPQHEQGGIHAAEGYAFTTGKTGVVVVTSGPGTTNIATGLGNAKADFTPLVVITGQVPTADIGKDSFQECDTPEIVKTLSKKCWQVRDVNDLPSVLHEAFKVASTKPCGPVVIDMPADMLKQIGPYLPREDWESQQNAKPHLVRTKPTHAPDQDKIAQAIQEIRKAERPLFLFGGGARQGGKAAEEAAHDLIDATGIPAETTLMGLGVVSKTNPANIGMLGTHGGYTANRAVQETDALVVIGARLEERATGNAKRFAPEAKIIHVDIDPSRFGKCVRADLPIQGDCVLAMQALTEGWHALKDEAPSFDAWWKAIGKWQKEQRNHNAKAFLSDGKTIQPQHLVQALAEALSNRNAIITTDVGVHQILAAHLLHATGPGRFFTSGGFGTMGVGLPAAIGAQVAHPNDLVVCVSGDGSAQMTIQEMATATAYKLPVKMVVVNNGYLQMVRQLQDLGYDGRHAQTQNSGIAFDRIARAYGWKAFRCASPKTMRQTLSKWLAAKGPALLDCRVDEATGIHPIVPGGKALHEMRVEAPSQG